MQQIAYTAEYIILLDEYVVLISYKISLLRITSQRPLRMPDSVSCMLFNLKGLGRRTLTKQFFKCRLN